MRLYETVKKIPGGLLVVPMLLGATVNTVAPWFLDIGSFTTALLKTGALPFVALACFCCGTKIDARQAGLPLAKGASLIAVKIAAAIAIGVGVGAVWGPEGVWSLTPLALIPALSNASGSLYIVLANTYGDESDVGAQSILLINDGPFFTLLIYGASGMADVPFLAMLAGIFPAFLGFVLGNLDPEIRKRFGNPETVIPFMAFSLGAAMNLWIILEAGIPGLLLGILCVAVTGLLGYQSTRLFGGRPRAIGAAVGSTAGNAMATPAIIAAADPSLLPYVTAASAQIATSVLVTAVLCPILVAWLHRRAGHAQP